MNINIKYLIIGGIILLILVATHRNPVVERKERMAAEKAAHPDPLVYSIEQHNKKLTHNGSNGYNGVGSPVPLSSGSPGNPGVSGQMNPPSANPNSRYMNPSMQPYYDQQQQQNGNGYDQQYYGQPYTAPANPDTAGSQQQQQNNGYYPPPPLPDSSVVRPPLVSPRSMNNRSLDNGQPVAFSGSRVYQVSSDGNWKPMPDGTYKMANGANLVIRDGKKAIINN